MIVTAAIIAKNGKILIAKRKMGKWEFPGGRIEAGENLEECLKRELKEELDVEVKKIKPFMKVSHKYDFGYVELHVFIVKCDGEARAKEHEEIRWIGMDDIDYYDFMDADKKVVKELKKKWNEIFLKSF